jgi:HAE1 family hydrophobic/amphiphilic exporter-1
MNLIAASVERRVGVTVAVLLVVLFGALSLRAIPVQLTPDVSRPEITVTTTWRGAAPQEIEQEVVQRQEDELKSVPGVVKMRSESADSQGTVTLEFAVGTDMDTALLRVANHLGQVKGLPETADRPVISTVNTNDRPIAWMMLKPTATNARPIHTYQDFAEDHIKARLERVPGVARSNVLGGRRRELHVIVDPTRLAAYGLTVVDLMRALDRENVDVSAGSLDEGKRRVLVRTLAAFDAPDAVAAIALRTPSGRRVTVGDLAEVRFGHEKESGLVRQLGAPAMAINVQRESGSNVLEVMAGVKRAVADLNAGVLAEAGLHLEQVYDETVYIEEAIDLVKGNVWLGGLLAIGVLLLFLRAVSPTVVIATAIPISLIGAFAAMLPLGRTLNVISLAGLAFASGMVVDNAIVVLENVYSHVQRGVPPREAAVRGTQEVWGAVLSSSLTTIAVFLPVVFIEEEVGQLFRDIALAISVAIMLSLVVSVTVVPSFAAHLLGRGRTRVDGETQRLAGLVGAGRAFTRGVGALVFRTVHNRLASALVVVLLTAASVALSVGLAPRPEYLPEGNRNLVFAILLPPPGYNTAEFHRIGQRVETQMRPLWEKDPSVREGPPAIRHFFFVARGRQIFMGFRLHDPARVKESIPVMKQVLATVPGAIGIVSQASLFAQGLAGGRSIDVEFSGADLPRLVGVAGRAFGAIRGVLEGAQVRPVPSLDLGNPEIHVIPDRVVLADLGISAADLGMTVDAMVDGARASTVMVDGEELDLRVIGATGGAEGNLRTQDLENMVLRTPRGTTVPLDSLADVRFVGGPEQINRSERQRTITLQVSPPEDVPLATAMDLIRTKVVGDLAAQGALGSDVRVRLAGTADKLAGAFAAMQFSFLLAVLITYLLMAALFEDFVYPFVIMFSVPLAIGGGFLGLWVVNATIARQPLDTLTMLGFIILVGTIVNNAILVVHQSLNHMREDGMAAHDAIVEATRNRIRPIFMTVGTSVFGMLPLVVYPGAGSEIYRGLGSVVTGGLVVGTVFTIFLVPAAFALTLGVKEAIVRKFGGLLHSRPRPADSAGAQV